MTRTRLLIDNAIYHIIARGNNKMTAFNAPDDFYFYLKKIETYKRRYDFLLYGYCLMPNHIHLIGTTEDTEMLSCFMHALQRSYTAYYNQKYKRVGHLWQGRFKNKAIVKDQHLLDCINYIELNPVRAHLVIRPGDYLFSSYKERAFNAAERNTLLNELIV